MRPIHQHRFGENFLKQHKMITITQRKVYGRKALLNRFWIRKYKKIRYYSLQKKAVIAEIYFSLVVNHYMIIMIRYG